MIPNVKPSQLFPIKAQIAPASVAAAATVTSGWIDAADAKWALAGINVGAGAGTFAVKLEQATSSGGAGAKDLCTATQLGITAQGTGTAAQAEVDLTQYIDVDGGFRYIRLSATCTGGAGTIAGLDLRTGPSSLLA